MYVLNQNFVGTAKTHVLDPDADLTKGSEVPSAGCGPFTSIQQEYLGQAQQEEHSTQHHHALFELHVHTDRS